MLHNRCLEWLEQNFVTFFIHAMDTLKLKSDRLQLNKICCNANHTYSPPIFPTITIINFDTLPHLTGGMDLLAYALAAGETELYDELSVAAGEADLWYVPPLPYEVPATPPPLPPTEPLRNGESNYVMLQYSLWKLQLFSS